MAPNFPHSIFDPLSCTGTQWIVDKVMIEHSLHSVLICDIHTVRFPLDCSRAAVCPCTLFRVRCRPHSEGCGLVYEAFRGRFTGFCRVNVIWLKAWSCYKIVFFQVCPPSPIVYIYVASPLRFPSPTGPCNPSGPLLSSCSPALLLQTRQVWFIG